MTKLFGFFKARGAERARIVRVEASGRMSRDELRRKLVAISARKSHVQMAMHGGREASNDEQPPSLSEVGRSWQPATQSVAV